MQALLTSPDSYISPAKLPAITNAALATCDGIDGVPDGVINRPRQCHFNPGALLCVDGDNNSCLTAPQLTALMKIYQGPHASEGQINPGFLPGAEAYSDPAFPNGWVGWITGPGPDVSSITRAAQYQFGTNFFKYVVFNDPNWDLRTLNFETDVEKALATPVAGQALGDVLQSVNPNLSVLRAHGAKMIQYHGTVDYAIPPGNSIQYYLSVLSFFGIYDRTAPTPTVSDFYRLFLVPGMQHCLEGPGANSFSQVVAGTDPAHDVIKALEAWVEHNTAPNQIIATKYTNDDPTQPVLFTRPLCPYPAVATWKGTGDASEAANWSCHSR